jgi:hypothetical protein
MSEEEKYMLSNSVVPEPAGSSLYLQEPATRPYLELCYNLRITKMRKTIHLVFQMQY